MVAVIVLVSIHLVIVISEKIENDIWVKDSPSVGHWTGTAEFEVTEKKTIDGFAIDDLDGNVRHYMIDNLDEMPCDDYYDIVTFDITEFEEFELLEKKFIECSQLEKTHTAEDCRPLIQNGNEFLICDDK